MRRIKSSCSALLSAPIVKASSTPRERITQSLRLPVAQIALAENLHADHSFAGSLHLAQNTDHRQRVGVHVRADGIDAGQIDLHPRRLGSRTQRLDAVAGTSMSANDSLLPGFGEHVHHAFEALGPIRFSNAVH